MDWIEAAYFVYGVLTTIAIGAFLIAVVILVKEVRNRG